MKEWQRRLVDRLMKREPGDRLVIRPPEHRPRPWLATDCTDPTHPRDVHWHVWRSRHEPRPGFDYTDPETGELRHVELED